MGKFRRPTRPPGAVWHVSRVTLKPTLLIFSRRAWRNGDRIPYQGGVVVAMNHISHIDPLLSGLLMWDYGRVPRYIAKSSLFGHSKIVDWWLTRGGQVPVDRSAGAEGFQAAIDVVASGDLLVVYLEGSITKGPISLNVLGPRTEGAARQIGAEMLAETGAAPVARTQTE